MNISVKSTKEEIAQFFSKEFNISEKEVNNIIKENISGDILLYLKENEFKSLGIKVDELKKIQLCLKENRDKFIEKQINITVNDNSSIAEVKNFFEEYLVFEGNLDEMDGQTMFKLSEEQMKNLRLNIGQRKRLIKYIKHVKKVNDDKKYRVKISKNSTQKEVNQFLKEELKFSDRAIETLGLDAISLFLVTEKEIDDFKELNQEEKENYKNFLKRGKDEHFYLNEIEEEKEINDLNKEDKKEDIIINGIEKKQVNHIIKETFEKVNEYNKEGNTGKNEIQKEIIKIQDNQIINNVNNSLSNNNKNEIINNEKKINNNKTIKTKNKILIKKEYKGTITSNIKYFPLYNYKTTSIVKDSKYNLFFILILKEENINKSYLSIFKYNSYFFGFKEEYINYSHYFLDQNEKTKNYEKIRILMVQVPLEKKIKKLTINLLIDISYNYNFNYKTDIDIRDEIENYFYLDNLNYYEYKYYSSYYSSYYPTLNKNEIFTYFLNYFFNEKNNKDKTIKISLLKALISKINNEIDLSVEIILKLLKYCLHLKIDLKNINLIKIIEQKNYHIPNELYLSNEDLHNFVIQKKEKTYLINLIIKIYASYNKKFLMELILSKDSNEYTRIIFDLLNEKELKYKDLVFNNQEDNLAFRKNLLKASKNKKEVNYVIKLSKGLTSCLEFILENIKTIYFILNEKKSFFSWNESSCLLSLSELEKDINIDKIYDLLKQILEFDKECKIINFDNIFNDLIDLFSNKSLNELYNLIKIEKLLKSNKINLSNTKKFYDKIHFKGLRLIQNKKMNIEGVIDFIYSKDIYYYDYNYKRDELRDPIIFKYILITESDPNYKTNIQMLKEMKIWGLYADSTNSIQTKFYKYFLDQIDKVKDLHNIFDLFSMENIDKNFNILINKKLDSIIYTALDEKKENYHILFDIFKNILICNHKNNLEQKIYELDYDFTSQFFLELLKDKNVLIIINEIKQKIIDFFLKQKKEGKVNEEQLIFLLLLSPSNDFSIHLLNQMNNMVLTENDFYEKEDTKNFILFKIFFEKCDNFIKNEEISNGEYLLKSILLKSKLYDDLFNSKVKYETIKYLIDEENILYNKIMVIFNREEKTSRNVYNKIKKNFEICTNKFEKFELIEEYYNIFFKNTKQRIINKIGKRLNELKQKNLDEIVILNEKDFIIDNEFNSELAIKESENIKYVYSSFFMSIYNEKKYNEFFDISEKQIFDDAKIEFNNSLTRIINQPETKEAFFEINNINDIMNVIKVKENYNMEEEINFIQKEFAHLKKENYIQNNLLNDLINFTNKEKIQRLIEGIIYFIETYKKIVSIEETRFLNDFRNKFKSLNSKGVSGEDIKEAINLLNKCNLEIGSSLNKFYELFLGKNESLLFIKKIKDTNLDIRNLNEFIDENENSQLQTTDIDNFLGIYTFFQKIMDNKNIKTDEDFFKIFKENFESQNNIIIQLKEYLNCYGEIIQLFQLYDENSEMTIQKVYNILKCSKVEIFKDENNYFIYRISYLNQKKQEKHIKISEIDELKNKILISSTNTNLKENGKDDKIDKKKLTNQFIKLIDNIKHLTNILNSLFKSGYPYIINMTLKVEDSFAFDANNKEKDLQKIINEYININKKNQKIIKRGYEKFPLLRTYYGQQFIQLYEKVKGNESNISNLVSLMTLKKIKNFKVQYKYNNEINNLENINNYLKELYEINQVNIEDIYNKNKVIDDIGLNPGLYRKIRAGDDSEMIMNIINIYINLTGNCPIVNTLLICNEETSIEEITCFLYRAILCNEPILYVIANIEYLELSKIQNIMKIVNKLYNEKNKNINSYLLFIYQKVESGLGRHIEKLIPEKNVLNNIFLKQSTNNINIFNETEVYSSIFAGYGKTTEIKYKVKDKNGILKYLPIGGSFNRDYVINNLENLKLDSENQKEIYLHINLSETDNDELMNEILFKLLILRYLDSNEKIYYLGYEINIIIEIPNGFIIFEEKYKILKLFKKIYIEKLCPLRLEENAILIKHSPISIVAETLYLYETQLIRENNINLEDPITKSAYECELIINRHFEAENQNYYQKMNFIKILSVQFEKFSKNIYFNYELANECGKGHIIDLSRELAIKNFIALTKVFTRSPYDSVLLRQIKSLKNFGKYDENKLIENALRSLENDKQEIFSFELIKPSLVFFNKDGHSLSIITNNNKNDEEYLELKTLWNSQNFNNDEDNDLIDYKNLTHEDFLKEIKVLFSLNDKSIDEIKRKLCDDTGKDSNYVFVSDNYIKMIRILLNIEAKIPVILMGETGVGKTKLLEILSKLYGNFKCEWEILQIHAGTTDQKIVSFIDEIIKKKNMNGNQNELTWVFLDEINTCNSLGLITEIMCNHTYLGKKIDENFIFIAACNPYRLLTKKMRESGLVYYNMKESNKLNNLVYTVNPLPHSLLNFVFDFGSIQPNDEKKYVSNTIFELLKKIKENESITEDELKKITDETIQTIIICHSYIKEIYDESSVSMREIRRFRLFFEFFIEYYKKKKINFYNKMLLCLNITLYLCYYLRLNDKKDRKQLSMKLNKYFNNNFIKIPEKEIKYIVNQMNIEKHKGIALNRALRENLFTTFICIINSIPLIIVGKPGTSKSLSFQILYNTMKGQYSEKKLFKNKGKLYRYYYQGSETSTSEGIIQVFEKARNAQKKNKNNNIISLVFFDEMGLAERSSNNPLKVIHYLLEKDTDNSVPFLGISNWKLDASKINRALSLTISDYDNEDLEETAISIADSLDSELRYKYQIFFETLARTYNKYIIINNNRNDGNKDFHGNRDFYNLIKNAMREMINKKNKIKKSNQKKILTQIGIYSLERNFGGLEYSTQIIKKIFKEEFGHNFDEKYKINKSQSILKIIESNISDSNSRYLMLISDGNDANDILKYILNSKKKNYIEIVGSKYKADIKSGKYSEEILNKIKYIMETDNILILRDLDMIYASLYDLFNQNFTCMGDKKYARIAFEYAKISSEVNKDFHVIVIIDINKLQNLKLDPPFLNRFEKHILNYRKLLSEKDIEIAKKIQDYISLISTFNNNEKLKLDLEKLLINCEKHNIEGLIFKIKNDKLIEKDDPQYKNKIIDEVFNIIVPTFCQDIIASIISSNMDLKYQSMKDKVIKIYRNSRFYNYESFFEKLNSRKNIIYTFSKATENLFKEGISLNNKFGKFKKQSAKIEMIESIKSENDLIFLLKSFFNSNNEKLLILRFSENDLNKINSVNHVLNNYEKENKVQDKLIIFIIHIQRKLKSVQYKKIIPDMITFINDEYNQIFIDNLQGKENLDIFEIISKQMEILDKDYFEQSNFIYNKIYTVLNYIKYNILYETKEFNMKNCTSIIAEKILNNKILKQFILTNIEKQGESIKGIINEVFTSDIIEENDVDFFEVIHTKLSYYFCEYLLNIIFYILKQNILIPILNNENLDILFKIDYFKSLIISEFENTKYNFVPKLKLAINSNEIILNNGITIPQSNIFLGKIITYANEEKNISRYIINEESLRKKYNKQEENTEILENYYDELDRLEENIKVEINKYEYFKIIYNQDTTYLPNLLLDDYLKSFIIKYLKKNDINYKNNESILSFLKLIIKIRLSENNNHHYDFKYTINELAKIILFTQGYKIDIMNLLNIYNDLKKYCVDIDKFIEQVLNENIIKYEYSNINQKNSKIVNITFFNIIESLSRSLLLYSVVLIQEDKNKFFDFSRIFKSLEASLQKLNKKYNLLSKEIYNIKAIIKIQECYKYNQEQFVKKYEIIVNYLLDQTLFLNNHDYDKLFNIVLDLNKLFDETFTNKNEEYINLLFFILTNEYKLIKNEKLKIKLIEHFFKNTLLIKKSKILLSKTLKNMKPESPYENNIKEDVLINNFMNLKDNKKLSKYKNLIELYNNINSNEFNELLLYTFETQCQLYFLSILNRNNNKYTQKTCSELLLQTSLGYLKKALIYLYEHIDNNDNNLLKLYAIAYLKTYYYYYVEIHHHHFDKCNFEQINELFRDETENNKVIRKMRNIYFWKVYFKKFENFDMFESFISEAKDIPLSKELLNRIRKDKENETQYIFKESFITKKCIDKYKKNLLKIGHYIHNKNEIDLDYKEINEDFDFFYCILVNKIISYLNGSNKDLYFEKMKDLYNITKDNILFKKEGKILYEYLMDEELFEDNIINKISKSKLNQNDSEILLYLFRFIFNMQMNHNKNFYNNLLDKNVSQFINENYIPGSFPFTNDYINSYYDLEEKFENNDNYGYYICKDCGLLYEVKDCTYPTIKAKCLKGHDIGGEDNYCTKMDIRVYKDINELNYYNQTNPNYANSFISTTFEQYKNDYVDPYFLKKEKGIMIEYRLKDFDRKDCGRNINIITFWLLNFILYSFLLGSYILDYLSKEQMQKFLYGNIFPFEIIKNGWTLLDKYLKEVGFENVNIFINMIFDKIIELINNLESLDTKEKLDKFENSINKYILGIITDKNNISQLNKEYHQLNNELLKLNPQNIKEIIQSNNNPSIYPQYLYPDIQYYFVSKIHDFNTFVQKFNSSKENVNKYALINILINKDSEITKDAINMKNLININKLSNLLLNIYSYKITREDAKGKILLNEVQYILDNYNEIKNSKISDENEFLKKYLDPFIESWNNIKNKSVQYKCRVLRNLEGGEKPLEINYETCLSYFLVDDGEIEGGMFLASAYQNLIEWQNKFIDDIISKNNKEGILSSYVTQLEKEINIQDANEYEIINISDNIYKILEDLIYSTSMRNIFDNKNDDNQINYSNYNDIIYDYDLIEEEMGRIILPGLKKFKKDNIKYITYLYEGFRGKNSSILIEYNDKYNKRDLSEEEKNYINEIISTNNNNFNKFIKDIFSSLQILMNEIIKENYPQNHLIYNIIKSLPKYKYIILNEELIKIINNTNTEDINSFTVNSLVSIFEYFEDLCWNEIKKYIPPECQEELNENLKQYIINYFDIIKNEKKIVTKKNLTSALRKLISRFIVGTRLDVDIKFDDKLYLYIERQDLWNKNIIENKSFYEEISKICKEEILIKHVWSLYNLLEGDYNKYIEMQEGKKKQNNNNIIKENNEFKINTNNNQNIINDNSINKEENEEDEEDEKVEEDEEESKEDNDEERDKDEL